MTIKKKVTKVVKKVVATGTESVMFGRFGEQPKTIKVKKGATVKDMLSLAGVTIGTKEKVWVNGTRATFETKVKSGDIVAVVSPKEAGNGTR